jgi:anti-sigma factor RsiW
MADQPDTDADAPEAAHEEWEVRFSDLLEGTGTEAERAEVEAHLASCAPCKAAFDDLERTMRALTQLKTSSGSFKPPERFTEHVEQTLARRSGGRFFGKKTLGDRVPFGVLLIVALVILVGAWLVYWSSSTGTLRYRPDEPPPKLAPGATDVVPRP